ncbi:periplasmic component of amino acid ABC-type tra nsporter/signal transduction system, partial [Mycobacterium sp. PO2]
MFCKDCLDSRPGIRPGMKRLGGAVAIAVLLAGCGGEPAEQAASSPDSSPRSTPTTTGLVPTGV